jgi:hypothetical protein
MSLESFLCYARARARGRKGLCVKHAPSATKTDTLSRFDARPKAPFFHN